MTNKPLFPAAAWAGATSLARLPTSLPETVNDSQWLLQRLSTSPTTSLSSFLSGQLLHPPFVRSISFEKHSNMFLLQIFGEIDPSCTNARLSKTPKPNFLVSTNVSTLERLQKSDLCPLRATVQPQQLVSLEAFSQVVFQRALPATICHLSLSFLLYASSQPHPFLFCKTKTENPRLGKNYANFKLMQNAKYQYKMMTRVTIFWRPAAFPNPNIVKSPNICKWSETNIPCTQSRNICQR